MDADMKITTYVIILKQKGPLIWGLSYDISEGLWLKGAGGGGTLPF